MLCDSIGSDVQSITTVMVSTKSSRPAATSKLPQAIVNQAAQEARPDAARISTDKLRHYGAAKRDVMPGVEHRSHQGLNNRAENSHLPPRERERMMQGFRSANGLQRFFSVFSAVRNLFVAGIKNAKPSPPTFIIPAPWRSGTAVTAGLPCVFTQTLHKPFRRHPALAFWKLPYSEAATAYRR